MKLTPYRLLIKQQIAASRKVLALLEQECYEETDRNLIDACLKLDESTIELAKQFYSQNTQIYLQEK